jgi:hypothetical protein
MLVAGFFANFGVKPLADHWYMKDEEVAALQSKAEASATGPGGSFGIDRGGLDAKAVVAWLAVGIPLAWGIYVTLNTALVLFK